MLTRWAILLLLNVYLIAIGMGFITALTGPTLLYLAELVNSEVNAFTIAFTGKFIGVIFGGMLVGVVNHKTSRKVNPLYFLGGSLFIISACNMVTPWINTLLLMFFVLTLIGVTFGYLDSGLQGLILRIWNSTTSRPFIYLYHFMVGIGGFIAPIVVKPFLAMAYGQVNGNPSCPSNELLPINQSDKIISQNSTATIHPMFHPVGWAYIIIASFFAFATTLTFVFACLKVDEKAISAFLTSGKSIVEQRAEEPLCDLIWIFIPLIASFFCGVSNEFLFSNFIYPVTVCSELEFSVTDAAMVNSLYWIGFFAGRGSGIFAASYIKPKTISLSCMIGAVCMMSTLVIFGLSAPKVIWAVSIMHGFFVGPMYPAGVTWLSKLTNISGKYMFIFNMGGMIGCVVTLPLGGFLFQKSPFEVMYLACGLSFANTFCFLGALFAAKRYTKSNKNKLYAVGKAESAENNA